MKSDKAFFSGIEKNIGYVFENKGLIKTALTHSSYVNENKIQEIMKDLNFWEILY